MSPRDPVRVNVIVEGPTEETFVRDVLAPSLGADGVFLTARSVETGRRKSGTVYRGGMTTFAKARKDIDRWLANDPTGFASTMFDLYALTPDFPDFEAARRQATCYERVERLEEAMQATIGSRRFVPYIQLHEYEALLFSDVGTVDDEFRKHYGISHVQELRAIRETFSSPEEIDDGPRTAPSKRLLDLFPGYNKPLFGSLIAKRIGLAKMMAECRHFGGWVARLRELSH